MKGRPHRRNVHVSLALHAKLWEVAMSRGLRLEEATEAAINGALDAATAPSRVTRTRSRDDETNAEGVRRYSDGSRLWLWRGEWRRW